MDQALLVHPLLEALMDSSSPSLRPTVLGALIAIALQIIIAPNIAINDVVPNFVLLFTVITAIRYGAVRASSVGFILGLVYDLIAQGPIGVMSLVLALLGYSAGSLNKSTLTGSLAVQMVIILAAAFFGELLHSVILAIIGYDANFTMSLLMRVLPGTIYDSVIGLILLPLLNRDGNAHKRRTDSSLKTMDPRRRRR